MSHALAWNNMFLQNLINPRRNRRDDVITCSILHPSISDEEMADRLCCSKATIRKWRAIAHQFKIKVQTGDRHCTIRLKRPAYASAA